MLLRLQKYPGMRILHFSLPLAAHSLPRVFLRAHRLTEMAQTEPPSWKAEIGQLSPEAFGADPTAASPCDSGDTCARKEEGGRRSAPTAGTGQELGWM